MTVKPMKWTKTEDVRIGKMWYIVDRTLTETGEIGKDDFIISPAQAKFHLEKLRNQAKAMGMDPKMVPFEFGNDKFGEAIYRAKLRLDREQAERERKKEREMER